VLLDLSQVQPYGIVLGALLVTATAVLSSQALVRVLAASSQFSLEVIICVAGLFAELSQLFAELNVLNFGT
jgi:hypothetical protein